MATVCASRLNQWQSRSDRQPLPLQTARLASDQVPSSQRPQCLCFAHWSPLCPTSRRPSPTVQRPFCALFCLRWRNNKDSSQFFSNSKWQKKASTIGSSARATKPSSDAHHSAPRRNSLVLHGCSNRTGRNSHCCLQRSLMPLLGVSDNHVRCAVPRMPQ